MTQQLNLDLPVKTALGRNDFFISPANEMAVAQVENWRNWPAHKLLLIGPKGAGKTHLAHVWANMVGAQIKSGVDLDKDKISELSNTPLCIEDLDQAPATTQETMFHLHNMMHAGGQPLLITATSPVPQWGLSLRDLQSRMMACETAILKVPDDILLGAVMLKRFADKQITPSPEVVQYVLTRVERSFAAVHRTIDALDQLSLSEQRPITRAVARRVLEYMKQPD